METLNIQSTRANSKAALWTGWILSGLAILFLLFDSIMKLIRESHSVEGTVSLGFPDSAVQIIGTILFIFTILYCIPRTAVLGAVLITAYLGGATVVMILKGMPLYFPIVFGVIVWAGLFLRDARIRMFFPLTR